MEKAEEIDHSSSGSTCKHTSDGFVSEVQIFELLHIVKNPHLVMAMKLAAALVPASTPATLKGFLQLFTRLLHLSDHAKPEHHRTMSSINSQLEGLSDENLTFGTFLMICQRLIKDSSKKTSEAHRPPDRTSTTRRPPDFATQLFGTGWPSEGRPSGHLSAWTQSWTQSPWDRLGSRRTAEHSDQ